MYKFLSFCQLRSSEVKWVLKGGHAKFDGAHLNVLTCAVVLYRWVAGSFQRPLDSSSANRGVNCDFILIIPSSLAGPLDLIVSFLKLTGISCNHVDVCTDWKTSWSVYTGPPRSITRLQNW